MTVAVAHKVSPTAHLVLREAGREASLRGTGLAVIEIVESIDLDIADAHRRGLVDEVDKVLGQAGISGVPVEVHLATGEDDISDAVLGLADEAEAELLVIGARRRTPVGKFLLGSFTQAIILDAEIPVLVIKAG